MIQTHCRFCMELFQPLVRAQHICIDCLDEIQRIEDVLDFGTPMISNLRHVNRAFHLDYTERDSRNGTGSPLRAVTTLGERELTTLPLLW